LLQRALEAGQNQNLVRQMLAAVFAGLGRIDEARAQYVSLLKENASDIDALYGLGRTYMHVGQQAFEALSKHKESAFYFLAKAEFETLRPRRFHDLAEKHYRQAISISPRLPGLRVRLGAFLLSRGDAKPALAVLEEEIRLDPYSYESHFLLSFVRLLQGETDDALREIEQSAGIRPEFFSPLPARPVNTEALTARTSDLEARAAKGNAAAALLLSILTGEADRSIAARSALWRVEAKDVGSQSTDSRSKARALFVRKRYEEGIALLDKAPKAAAGLRTELAWAYFHSRSFERVTRLLASPDPRDPEEAYLAGAAYKQLASQVLERLVAIAPESARSRALMGDSLYAREQYAEAVMEYRAALEIQPSDPELLFALGNAHFKALEIEKANEAYTQVLAANPWHVAASHLNGSSLLLLNRPEEALPFLRKAIELAPRFGQAHATLGKALAALGRNDEAIKHLDAGAASDTDGSVHFQLFQLYRKQGNNVKAEEARRRSLELRESAGEFERAR